MEEILELIQYKLLAWLSNSIELMVPNPSSKSSSNSSVFGFQEYILCFSVSLRIMLPVKCNIQIYNFICNVRTLSEGWQTYAQLEVEQEDEYFIKNLF